MQLKSIASHLIVATVASVIAVGIQNAKQPARGTETAPAAPVTAPAAESPPAPTPESATPAAPSPEAVQALRKTSDAFVSIAKAVQPAVVNINTVQVIKQSRRPRMQNPFESPFEDFFGGDDLFRRFFQPPGDGEGPAQKRQGLGSGMIIDGERGYILTNNHVVADADEIKVSLADGRDFDAKVVGTDPQTDIGVLQITNPTPGLPAVRLGDSSRVDVGDWAIAVGNPFGLMQTVTVGIISAKGRSNVNITDYEDFFQTDAAINPGNSGGPLLNIDGEVIGVNTAIFSRSGGYQGIGFAIPSNMAKQVLESLISGKKIERGFLGVALQDMTEEIAKQLQIEKAEGALVSEVMPDLPAEKAGIKSGDVIVEFGGKAIKDSHELRNLVAFTVVGKTVPIVVLRDGQRVTIEVTLGARPDEKIAKGEAGLTDKLGIGVETITEEHRRRFRTEAKEGVVIVEVDPEGLGIRLGLREGDVILEVNRRPTKDVATFREITKELDLEKGGLLVLIDRQGRRVFLALNP